MCMNVDGPFKGEAVRLEQEVNPGETVDVTADMQTPSSEGRHVSVWRMVDNRGERFGHRFNAEIFVLDRLEKYVNEEINV